MIPNRGPIWNDSAGAQAAAAASGVALLAANNLSDLTNVTLARINLGLGSAATSDSSAFDAAGAAATALATAEAYARSLVGSGSVTQLLAGSGITLSPPTGTGVVTISSSGGVSPSGTITSGYLAVWNGPTSIQALNTIDNIVIGATTPANGTFTTLVGTLTEGLQNTNSLATLLYAQNTNAGTGAVSRIGLSNNAGSFFMDYTSTGYTGSALVTGGIAKSVSIYTNSAVPIVIGTNNTANLTIASGGAITLSSLAAASSGVVLSSTAGLLSALALPGSTTTFLRGDGTFAAPSGASFPASATLITNTSSSPVNTANVFNVQAYGAKGDGSNHSGAEDTAVANAIAALVANFSSANPTGTLYFPAGTYALTVAVTATIASPYTMTIRGDGRLSTFILQTVSGTNGITVNMSLSGSNNVLSSCEVRDISVMTNTTSNVAVLASFGATSFPMSTEAMCGITIDNVNFGTSTNSTSVGWTSGIALINPWKYTITNCNGSGGANGASLRSSGAVPLTTTATPGDGAWLYVVGGINGMLNNNYGSFWQYGVYQDNGPNAAASTMTSGDEYVIAVTGTTNWTSIGFSSSAVGTLGTYNGVMITGTGGQVLGLAMQGCFIRGMNFVAVRAGFLSPAGAFWGPLICSDWQLDQGNQPNNGLVNIGFQIGGSIGTACSSTFTNIFCTQANGASSFWFNLSHVQNSLFTGCVLYTGGQVKLANSSNLNVFNGCYFAGVSLSCDSSCSNNQANNTQGSSTSGWTGVGTGNTVKTTLY
jgi:hypothetical protein